MSTYKPCPAPLTPGEINKKILRKDARKRTESEYIGPNNKYTEENYKIYELKKRQFCDAAKEYHEMNKFALLSTKVKLEDAYENLNFEFLKETEQDDVENNEEYALNGGLLRKRSVRKIHNMPDREKLCCVIEPWFRRYLMLGKFVQAVRTVILKNRLLKNLGKLRVLTEEDVEKYDTVKKQCDNVSYKELFEKYL